MGDKLQKLTPGDRVGPGQGYRNAAWFNDTVDAIKFYKRMAASLSATDSLNVPSHSYTIIKNITGGTLAQYSIVGIGSPLVSPSGTDAYFFGDTVFESADPTSSGEFAILQEPARDDALAVAKVEGVTWVKVEFDDIGDGYAAPVSADYDKLASQATVGPARIISADTDAATQLNGAINNAVTTIVVDAYAAFPDPNFVITIGTEDMLVTAVSTTSWTVTRGHNSTTPASHSDNAAVVFKSGTVWARVVFNGKGWASSSGGITSINSDTSAAQTITVDASEGLTITNTGATHSIGTAFSVGTAGTGFGISWHSGSSTLRWDLPAWSLTATGILNAGTQQGEGSKELKDGTWKCYSSSISGLVTSITVAGLSIVNASDTSLHQFTFDYGSAPETIILNSGDDSNGNEVFSWFELRAPVRNSGNSAWTSHTMAVLIGAATGAGDDPAPCYALWNGATTVTGATSTTNGLDFVGGLFTGGSISGLTKSDVGLGNVENTALSTWTGSTSLLTMGYNSMSTDWNGTNPTNVSDALDRLAALLKTLNGGVGP